MATATFWQRGETIDRINDTAKTIPANTIQAIGKRIGVVVRSFTSTFWIRQSTTRNSQRQSTR